MLTTAASLLAVFVFVAFLGGRHDLVAVMHVLKHLQDNNKDVRQLVT
jgi:hypothetical protein